MRSGRIASLTSPVASSSPACGVEHEVAEADPAGPLPVRGRGSTLGVHQVRDAEEVGDVGVDGLVVDLLRGAELDDPSRGS